MNDVLKGVLKSLEVIGAAAVPGGAVIDQTVHSIIDHKGHPQAQVDDAISAVDAGIKVIEALKGVELADEVQFKAGAFMVERGAQLMHDALKAAPDPATV